MNAGHWQAILAAVTIAVLVVAALVNQERRLAHLDDAVLTQQQVIDIYARLAVLETRLERE